MTDEQFVTRVNTLMQFLNESNDEIGRTTDKATDNLLSAVAHIDKGHGYETECCLAANHLSTASKLMRQHGHRLCSVADELDTISERYQ